jgi:hypothetical protein
MAVVALLAIGAGPARAHRPDLDGTYLLDYLLVSVKAEVRQSPGVFVVVAKVSDLFGNDNTYTFMGHWQGDRVVAEHYQGHRFEGRVQESAEGPLIKGTLHTRWGGDYDVEATPSEKISENTETIDRRVREGELPSLQKLYTKR